MSVFKTIGDTLSRLVKGQKKPDGVDKSDILDLIDNNLVLLKVVINTFDENPSIMNYIQASLIQSKDNVKLMSLYKEYTARLNSIGRNVEKTTILKSIRDAAVLALSDHERIRDNFTFLFDQGTDASDIQIEQMKLSHAALFGFINLSTLMSDWFCFFYGNIIGQPGEGSRTPAYREQMITSSSQTVADFVSDVLIRGKNRTILDVVSSIKSAGDVMIYSSASTLDSYANINDYPGAMKLFGGFSSLFHPILFVREIFTQWAHSKYKRNLALREWMITKTAVLQMDLNGISPDSPEYQKKMAILNKYSDEIARVDKLISQYENS